MVIQVSAGSIRPSPYNNACVHAPSASLCSPAYRGNNAVASQNLEASIREALDAASANMAANPVSSLPVLP
eukprot:3311750-Pyramimonas_sp.AAC.1